MVVQTGWGFGAGGSDPAIAKTVRKITTRARDAATIMASARAVLATENRLSHISGPRGAEAAGAALCLGEASRLPQHRDNARDFDEQALRDAVPRLEGEGSVAVIGEADLDFPTIVAVDHADTVRESEAVLESVAAATKEEEHKAVRDFHGQACADRDSGPGRAGHTRDAGQVEGGRSGSGVLGELGRRVKGREGEGKGSGVSEGHSLDFLEEGSDFGPRWVGRSILYRVFRMDYKFVIRAQNPGTSTTLPISAQPAIGRVKVFGPGSGRFVCGAGGVRERFGRGFPSRDACGVRPDSGPIAARWRVSAHGM